MAICTWSTRSIVARSALMPHGLLLDRAEDRVAALVLHLDADRVAEIEERRRRVAGADGLDGALLGDAGVAEAALGDRLAGRAVGILVRHRARAHDGAGAQRPRLRRVGDERRKIESHVDAGVGAPEGLAVEEAQQRQSEL